MTLSYHAPEELALVPCLCRTRTEKMGVRECRDKFPVASCIMMGPAVLHFEMLDPGKRVARQEVIEYFDKIQEKGLLEALTSDNGTDRPKVDVDKCIGCGVFALTCSQETLALHRHERSSLCKTGRELLKTIAVENRE